VNKNPEHAMRSLILVSHRLCPYVQRIAIALSEKNVPFERRDVDLADKPDWFLRVSPLGKTPVLLVHVPQKWEPGLRPGTRTHNGDVAIFESAVILEYLEETQAPPLHPADPLARAGHRAFIEFGSAVLNDIAGLYGAPDQAMFNAKAAALRAKFVRLDERLRGPWFDGTAFSLVDAVFGPVFRYFDAFDRIDDFGILARLPKVAAWREALAARPSIKSAVASEYPALLRDFLRARKSHLSRLMEQKAAA
jgi:glutathione S-transferase